MPVWNEINFEFSFCVYEYVISYFKAIKTYFFGLNLYTVADNFMKNMWKYQYFVWSKTKKKHTQNKKKMCENPLNVNFYHHAFSLLLILTQ